jgi:hypothetical protein
VLNRLSLCQGGAHVHVHACTKDIRDTEATRSCAKHGTTLITAPAHISVLNDVFAWFILPSIAVGRFKFIPPMDFTLQNLKNSANKQYILHHVSIFSAATVLLTLQL